MLRTKSLRKNPQQQSIVMDAFFVEQSKFEMFLCLKNVLTFFLQSLSDLVDSNASIPQQCENLQKCHDSLKKILSEIKHLLKNETKLLIQEFLMESESVLKILSLDNQAKRLTDDQRTVLDTKRYVIEYLMATIENNLNLKNKTEMVQS
jgi:hypothetical protein